SFTFGLACYRLKRFPLYAHLVKNQLKCWDESMLVCTANSRLPMMKTWKEWNLMKDIIPGNINVSERKKLNTLSKHPDDDSLPFDLNTNSGAAEAPLSFTRPLEIISTYSFEEVASCLEQIEQKVADGYYTAGYFSYEMTYALNNMELNQNQQPKMPLLWFGVFDQPVTPSSSETKE